MAGASQQETLLPFNRHSEEAILKCLKGESLSVEAFLALVESNFKKDREIEALTKAVEDLTKRIIRLEKKTIKKAGRKRQDFYLNGKELTDDEIVYMIDYGFYDNISKLEKDVGAHKNQLRNRYNKEKKRQELERELKRNGNS